MKNKQFLSGMLVALFIFVAFGAGKAYAVGCFTDTNAVAACWLKSNGIAVPYSDGGFHPTQYLRRIDAANFIFLANKVPPRQGDFHIAQALSSVLPNSNYITASVEYYSDTTLLRTSTLGTQYFQTYLTMPTSMYGRAVYLKGVQICYNATFGGASLTNVGLSQFLVNSSGDVLSGASVFDATIRTDKACRVYKLTTPAKLAGDNHAVVTLGVNFSSTSEITGRVFISAVTAILSPSLQTGTLDTLDSMDGSSVFDPATSSGAGQ
jgi:hypothetical protein